MLTFETQTIEEGIRKTFANAKDLIKAAEALRSLDEVSNNEGYSVLFTQTGLEEVAKASFLFEQYLKSLRRGQVRVSNREWNLWMGGRYSHVQRVARIQFLYALSEQVSAIPGASIMFPQSVKELLQNRNAALYVDYDHELQDFKAPADYVDPKYMTAKPGFARHIVKFVNYDSAIDSIGALILNDNDRASWFVRSIEEEAVRKRDEVLIEAEAFAEDNQFDRSNFKKRTERLFCARKRSDGVLEILHGCALGTSDDSIFFLDEHTNSFAFRPDGKVIHARLSGTKRIAKVFRNEWEIIDSLA